MTAAECGAGAAGERDDNVGGTQALQRERLALDAGLGGAVHEDAVVVDHVDNGHKFAVVLAVRDVHDPAGLDVADVRLHKRTRNHVARGTGRKGRESTSRERLRGVFTTAKRAFGS